MHVVYRELDILSHLNFSLIARAANMDFTSVFLSLSRILKLSFVELPPTTGFGGYNRNNI